MTYFLCNACQDALQSGHFACGGPTCPDCGDYCSAGPDDGPGCDGPRQSLLASMPDTGIEGFFKARRIGIDLHPTTPYQDADAAADSWAEAARGPTAARFFAVREGGRDAAFLCYISGSSRTGVCVWFDAPGIYGHVWSLDGGGEHVEALIDECQAVGLHVVEPDCRWAQWPFGPAIHIASLNRV